MISLSFAKMSCKVLYSNSNEIRQLIESTCGWTVSPLEEDDDSKVGELLVFDLLFYDRPDHDWTTTELLRKRPEWGARILPLLKERQYALLFTTGWYIMSYVKEVDKILFQPAIIDPKRLKDGHGLLGTESLTFMMRQTIKNLLKPATYAMETVKRLSAKIKRPLDFGTPTDFRDVCESLEALVLTLDEEVSHWKDRFFFDALDADEDTLCSDCKESMRVAFYVTNDTSQALKWRPHEGECCHRGCRYYKSDLLDDPEYFFSESKTIPIMYRGWSDSD